MGDPFVALHADSTDVVTSVTELDGSEDEPNHVESTFSSTQGCGGLRVEGEFSCLKACSLESVLVSFN